MVEENNKDLPIQCFEIDSESELCQLELQHAPDLFRVVDENRSHLRKWLPWLDQNTREEHSWAFIQSASEQYQAGRGFVCGIFHLGQLVGVCGYHPRTGSDLTIGYWLAKNATGKGLVTRSARILITHAFAEMGVSKVNIPVAVENQKSRAVCENLGLLNGGIKKNAEYLYDRYVDHVLYYTKPRAWMEKHGQP